MKFFALPLAALFASTSFAASLPQSPANNTVQTGQDSANGSMTNTDLTGNLDQDTSQLNNGTSSGTSQGAIIDKTSKKKTKTKKKTHSVPAQESTTQSTSTESGTTSRGGTSNEALYESTTTQGRSRNDEMGQNINGTRPSDERGSREK